MFGKLQVAIGDLLFRDSSITKLFKQRKFCEYGNSCGSNMKTFNRVDHFSIKRTEAMSFLRSSFPYIPSEVEPRY